MKIMIRAPLGTTWLQTAAPNHRFNSLRNLSTTSFLHRQGLLLTDGGGEGPKHIKRPRGEWSLPHRTGLGIRGMRRYR